MTTTTKVMIELKDGVDAAMKRLRDVNQRRTIERMMIRSHGDENDSGWSEEELYDKKPTTPHPAAEAAIAATDFLRLFSAIGQTESLRHLMVDYYANPIPIKAFLELFPVKHHHQRRCRLESLELHHINFVGNVAEFQALAESLMGDSVCLKVCLSSCQAKQTVCYETTTTMTGSLVDALSSPSNLQDLTLEEMDIEGTSLVNLFRLPRLSHLKLRHIASCNSHMSLVAQGLRRNQSLQSLQIRYALDEPAALAFFQMLEENTSIETVDIDMDCWDTAGYGQSLGDALKTNQQLKDLELNVFGQDNHVEANAVALAQSLEENDSLRRLCLTFHNRLHQPEEEEQQQDADDVGMDSSGMQMERLSRAFLEPFRKAMVKNLALGILLVGPIHQRVYFGDRVGFYLKLNQAGRKELLQPNEASRNQWVETLISNVDDLDVLFYLLSMNPSLTEYHDNNKNGTSHSDLIMEPRYKRLKRD